MHVALISSGRTALPPKSGGAVELYVYKLAQALRKLGIKVWAIDRRLDDVRHEDIILRVSIPKFFDSKFVTHILGRSKQGILKELVFGFMLSERIHDFSFDIIHLSTAWSAFATTLKPCGKTKIVYTCHNGVWFEKRVHISGKIPLIIEGYIMRRADAVIVLNNAMRRAIIKKARVDPSKIFVIPNGVDTEFFRPGLKCREIAKKIGLDENFVILFVGRILPSKGVHVLLEALKILRNKYGLSPKTIIAGPLSGVYENDTPSQYTKMLMEYIKKNELDVTFLGGMNQKILKYLYSYSHVLVLPSYFEAFPMVLIEAMASGCPVIGSKVGGIPEIIEDGINGFLFEKGDAEDLAKKLYIILDDEGLAKRLGIKAREIAVKNYDWTVVASKMIDVYNWVALKDK